MWLYNVKWNSREGHNIRPYVGRWQCSSRWIVPQSDPTRAAKPRPFPEMPPHAGHPGQNEMLARVIFIAQDRK